MSLPLSKVIDAEDFGAPDLAPYLQEIGSIEAARAETAIASDVPDPRQWQYAMALRALDRQQVALSGRLIAGVGAGVEPTIFALARRGAVVLAADRYLDQTTWSDTSPAGMVIDPAPYSGIDYPPGNVIGVHADALALNLPSNTFHAAFSNGVFEHLGSLGSVATAAREIGRILRPGGVASIATEFRVDGPVDRPWFDDAMMLFTPALIDRYIVQPSGLVLHEPLVIEQSDATFETRRHLADFPDSSTSLPMLDEKRSTSPSLVVYHDGFLFCSVVLTLFKPADSDAAAIDAATRTSVARHGAALSAALECFQRAPPPAGEPSGHHLLFGEVERLRADNDALRAMYDRSNAWKRWSMMRPARFVYRRIRRWRG